MLRSKTIYFLFKEIQKLLSVLLRKIPFSPSNVVRNKLKGIESPVQIILTRFFNL